MTMNVAVPSDQHSEMLGQRLSWQTVLRPHLFMARLTFQNFPDAGLILGLQDCMLY
jgi:hypothetical protein